MATARIERAKSRTERAKEVSLNALHLVSVFKMGTLAVVAIGIGLLISSAQFDIQLLAECSTALTTITVVGVGIFCITKNHHRDRYLVYIMGLLIAAYLSAFVHGINIYAASILFDAAILAMLGYIVKRSRSCRTSQSRVNPSKEL